MQNNPGDPGPQCRRPPTVFDSVDFPPPYTSRAPSLSETLDWEQISLEENAEGGTQFSGRQAQIPAENGYQTYEHPTEGRESEISAEFDRGNSVASRDHEVQHSGGVEGELGSPLGAAWSIEGCVPDVSSVRDDNFSGSLDVESGVYLQLPRGSQETELPDDHEVASINSDSGSPNDDVFTSSSSLGEGAYPKEAGTSRSDTQFLESDRGGRWDSCPHNCQQTTSDEIYCAHNEIYTSVVPPNVNPWGRTMSEQDAGASCGRASPQHAKFRSNSIPCLPASQDRVLKLHKGCQTPDVIAGETSGEAEPADCEGDGSSAKRSASHEEPGGLFRHFKESNATRQGRHKRRKRPRNNPGHILEKETGKSKTIGKGDAVVLTEPSVSNIGETNV